MSKKNEWKDVKVKTNKLKSKPKTVGKNTVSTPIKNIKIVRKDQRTNNSSDVIAIDYNKWEPEYKHF
jgi:hypothetical protein